MKQYVVMVAGGTGTRMRQTTAKQFLNVEGLPLMWWTLRRSKEALPEAEVTLVLHESLFEEFSELEREYGSAGARHVVPGGAERFHSVLAGLNTLPDSGIVGIHDAVRPFPSVETRVRSWCRCARSTCCSTSTASAASTRSRSGPASPSVFAPPSASQDSHPSLRITRSSWPACHLPSFSASD